jgi:hypothetical protein
MGYNEASLAQVSVLNLTPNGNDGGIWAAGSGPAADAAGNLYTLLGNGTFESNLNPSGFPPNSDYGNAFVKLSTGGGTLALSDYFNMSNTVSESGGDVDLGSGGAMLLPSLNDAQGRPRALAVGAGKDHIIYVVDQNNMGKFTSNTNAIYQSLPNSLSGSVFSSPAWFNGTLYYGAVGDRLKAFAFTNGLFGATPVSQSGNSYGYPGATPSISASGTADGIVWAAENSSTAVLHAYDAANLAHELYNSNQAASGRDHFGAGNKFIVPTVANGKVFVGTTNGVGVFGLLCSYAVIPLNATAPAGGGTQSVKVTATNGCAWTATSDSSFLSILSGGSGTGSGVASYQVTANAALVSRIGTLTIAGQTFALTQAAASGAPSIVSVTPASGTGVSATFAVTVTDAAGTSAIGLIYLQINSILSAPSPCYVEFNPALNTFRLTNDAGSAWLGPVTLGTAAFLSNHQCTLSAANGSRSTSGNNITINVPLNFALAFGGAKNTFAFVYDTALNGSGWSNTGTWTVAGCLIGLSANSVGVGSAGGSGPNIQVSTQPGCTWTAVSNAGWLHLVSGVSGRGPGTIAYNADPNSSPIARTATLNIGGQSCNVTQQPPVATNTEAFVRQLYLDLLGRTADPNGLNTWVSWINTGVFTRAQVASQFFQSAEFSGNGVYITKLYEGIMLRDPDFNGWIGWFTYLSSGYSQTDILNQFLASSEFQSRYGNLDNTAFVTLAYNNILNRPPDPTGLAQWVQWLNDGTYTRAQVMYFFITSQEFDLRIRNRVYANLLYIGFLRRTGDPAGLDGWTNWLANGTYTLDQEVNGFITSPEYLARF